MTAPTTPERLLILAKTYPTLSTKYGEIVCTAAMRADGSWVRLYPVPYRPLGEKVDYDKYDWVECRIQRNSTDCRPESHRPLDFSELTPVCHLDTSQQWLERRRIVVETAKVFDKLEDVIDGAKRNSFSLAVFRPTKVLDFICEPEESRHWDPQKLAAMRTHHIDQLSLLEDNEWRQTFRVVDKLPYKFSYRFVDAAGKKSQLQIIDWEIGALYWKCFRKYSGYNEKVAIAKVRAKYLDSFSGKDLYFFLGTTLRYHAVSPNPYLIIGVFYPPFQDQLRLF